MKPAHGPLFTEAAAERDAALVRAILAGDRSAFDQLVEAYQRVAVSTAYRLLNNSEDAQEIAQEAFIKAYRSLDRLQDPRRFGAWLLRIVGNLALNARRSRRSMAGVPLDDNLGAEAFRPEDPARAKTAGPERRLEGQELQAALDAALAQLPEKQRTALLLFAVEGWAQKDIAQLLDCSLETVKWSVFQARRKLRELMGDMIAD